MTGLTVGATSAPLRVVFVLDSLGSGGAERSTAVLLPMLALGAWLYVRDGRLAHRRRRA